MSFHYIEVSDGQTKLSAPHHSYEAALSTLRRDYIDRCEPGVDDQIREACINGTATLEEINTDFSNSGIRYWIDIAESQSH